MANHEIDLTKVIQVDPSEPLFIVDDKEEVYLTLAHWGQVLGYSPTYLRGIVNEGSLRASMWDRRLVVGVSEMQRYLEQKDNRGRPIGR